MKKMLALILTFSLAVTLAACSGTPSAGDTGSTGGNSAGGTSDGSAGTDSGTDSGTATTEISGDLLIWFNNDDYAGAMIEAFNVKYPNVNVRYEKIDGLETAEKLSLEGPAGIGADVIWTAHDRFPVADGYIEPFPADAQARIESLIIEAAIGTATHDGKLYGVPFQLDNVALFYNKDIVPEPPATFEEIIEFAGTYNDPAAGKYALRLSPNNSYANYIFLTAFGYSWFGPNRDDWKNPGFDSPEAARGLAYLKSLREIFDVDTADATYDFSFSSFDRGEVPFVINGPWGVAGAKNGGVNFGVAKIPTINGVQPYAFSGTQIIAVSSYSKNFDAAFAFAEFTVSEEGARILYETLGVAATLKDVSGIPGLSEDEYLRGFMEQAPFTHPQSSIPQMYLSWQPTITMMEFIWDGVLTIEEAQAKAMEDYELLLNTNGQSMFD